MPESDPETRTKSDLLRQAVEILEIYSDLDPLRPLRLTSEPRHISSFWRKLRLRPGCLRGSSTSSW